MEPLVDRDRALLMGQQECAATAPIDSIRVARSRHWVATTRSLHVDHRPLFVGIRGDRAEHQMHQWGALSSRASSTLMMWSGQSYAQEPSSHLLNADAIPPSEKGNAPA